VALLAACLRWGLWIAPAATLLSAAAWGSLFWRNVSAAISLTSLESRRLWQDGARILGISVATCTGFLLLYPATPSWLSLILEALLCGAVLSAGYVLSSASIRTIAREELNLTLRALRPI
jgi:hypothetical protein